MPLGSGCCKCATVKSSMCVCLDLPSSPGSGIVPVNKEFLNLSYLVQNRLSVTRLKQFVYRYQLYNTNNNTNESEFPNMIQSP